MQNMRMPKGWTFVGTNDIGFGKTETRAEKTRRMRKFDNLIRNTSVLSYDEMVKENDQLFNEQTATNAALLQAYNDKKLKSKELIKKARRLKNKNKKNDAVSVSTAD